MGSKVLEVMLALVLIVGLAGCATTTPHERASTEDSKIVEEDLTDTAPDRSEADVTGPSRSSDVVDSPVPSYDQPPHYEPPVDGEPQAAQDQQSPLNETESSRPPRKFKWRDRKGAQKGWELSNEGEQDEDPGSDQ